MVSFKLLVPLMLFVILSESPSASGGNTFQLQKVRVYMYNFINYFSGTFHPNITVKCKSLDDELPAVEIPFLGHDFLHFKVNIWASTYFKCDMWYADKEYKIHMLVDVFLYNFKLHNSLCDHNNCYWIANEYGLFLKTGEFVQPNHIVSWGEPFPEELKKYNPKNKIPWDFIPKIGMPKPEKPGGVKPPGRGGGSGRRGG